MNILIQLNSINWADIATAATTLCMALIAKNALDSWKHQMRVARQLDFIDQLTDSTYAYIQAFIHPLENILEAYTDHAQRAERLSNLLAATESYRNSFALLMTKGDQYNFSDFNTCKQACTALLAIHERTFFKLPQNNFRPPPIQKYLKTNTRLTRKALLNI